MENRDNKRTAVLYKNLHTPICNQHTAGNGFRMTKNPYNDFPVTILTNQFYILEIKIKFIDCVDYVQ